MLVLTLRWHVLRVCTYKNRTGVRNQIPSLFSQRDRAEIPKLLKYFNNFESNCYIKYLFNFRTGATFSLFSYFFEEQYSNQFHFLIWIGSNCHCVGSSSVSKSDTKYSNPTIYLKYNFVKTVKNFKL